MKKELKNTEYSLEKIFKDAKDFLPLLGTDYIEFYVGNAKQAAHFYKTAFGFQSHAYAGLETGLIDRVSYVLKQDKIKIVLLLLREISFLNLMFHLLHYNLDLDLYLQSNKISHFQLPCYLIFPSLYFYYQNLDNFNSKIDEFSSYLSVSQSYNYDIWQTLGTYVWPNPVWFDTHQEEVDYVKQWLLARMNWLNQEFGF